MSRVVRSSKFRHVFGQLAKTEACYNDIRLTRTAHDSNFVAVNPEFIALMWDAAGGGSFAVMPHSMTGKLDPHMPLINGHKNAVLDVAFNPFNDFLVASCSEDGYAKIWQIPDGGLKEGMSADDAVQTLAGHKRKVGNLAWHPTANNILATSSADYSVKIWDVEKGEAALSLDAKHTDLIQSCAWSFDGGMLATTCKDKKLRTFDPRTGDVAQEAAGHQGVKGARGVWLGDSGQLFTVGFTKLSEREFCVWDPANLENPVHRERLDSSSGVIMPFFDEGTKMVYLAGKGDGNIRYYEHADNKLYSLSEFKSSDPARGMAMMPKRGCNVSENEVAKMFRVTTKAIQPISFTVPRKSDMFQDDLFPDCPSDEPAQDAAAYLGGGNAAPKTKSLEGGFVKKEKVEATFEKKEEPKELSPTEMKAEFEKLTARVAYLEAELVKKDARIKELEG